MARDEKKYGRFMKILRKLYTNILFLEVITDMPSYANFLKDMHSNKGKLPEHTNMTLTKECSTIIQSKLPPKLFDLGSSSIGCIVGEELNFMWS